MYKKWLLLIIVTVLLGSGTVTILASEVSKPSEIEVDSELLDKTLRYTSNQYTHPEENVKPITQDVSLMGFEKIAENDIAELFVNTESLALKVLDKRTGYVWNSGLEDNEEYQMNDTWMNVAQSAITIDYLDSKGKEKSESILTNNTVAQISKTENGFTASIPFKGSGISIELDVQLDEDSIIIQIPNSGITEEKNKLKSLRVYPFLGSVHKDDVTGYMFIPDGSGALMRFQKNTIGANAPYQAFIYGQDEGFMRTSLNTESRVNPPQTISMPVYGLVHGTKQNGLFTIIEDGKEFGEIMAYPSGVSTDFNWITTRYHYRYSYFQPTSQSMEGYNTYQEKRNEFNITEKVTLLANDDADYVGMANTYQDYLVDRGDLTKGNDVVDIRLEFLGAELKEGLIWNSVHPMTLVTDIPNFVNKLKSQDVDNMHVVYRGWTQGGLTGTLPNKFPLEKKLGNAADFESVHAFFEEEGIPFYYYTDYTKAFDGAKGFSGRSDVARKINSQTIGDFKNESSYYYLNPEKSFEIAKNDLVDFAKNGISRLAIDTTGYEVFSDFGGKTNMRPDVQLTYTELLQLLTNEVGPLALYKPNDYLWSITERYLDIPMYSSNYRYVSDTVPFMQIVLKGYIPYYAEFSNFHSNTQDDVLRMVEYGAYPSFYLTKESSYLLMNSPSKDLYTSQFDEWEPAIVEQYTNMKDSLGQVEGETIEERIIHDDGVVEVVYSNEKSIIVNYTNKSIEIEGHEINAKDFRVVDWGSQS
ncbi:DUF5696 domain-containing protein [Bacillus sp. JJ1562]|uniref:DUF5696 domain-containing protein n=1 Tax=Bacillus sp. JJ1562 TaxID=3122960 RepID=UPI003001A4FE